MYYFLAVRLLKKRANMFFWFLLIPLSFGFLNSGVPVSSARMTDRLAVYAVLIRFIMITPPSVFADRSVPADVHIIAETAEKTYIFIDNIID